LDISDELPNCVHPRTDRSGIPYLTDSVSLREYPSDRADISLS